MSNIELIVGPMFSGKTTELLRRGKRYQLAGYRCLYVKWSDDNRYLQNKISTHDKLSVEAVSIQNIKELDDVLYKGYETLLIDEGQFFKDIGLIETFSFKHIIVAGLDADFNKDPFTNITNLLSVCNKIDKLSAICECGDEAHFTKLKNGIVASSNILVGGNELYKSVCRSCYFKG